MHRKYPSISATLRPIKGTAHKDTAACDNSWCLLSLNGCYCQARHGAARFRYRLEGVFQAWRCVTEIGVQRNYRERIESSVKILQSMEEKHKHSYIYRYYDRTTRLMPHLARGIHCLPKTPLLTYWRHFLPVDTAY